MSHEVCSWIRDRLHNELGLDREFPPSDTQIFPLTPSEAGEFKVYCRFHEAQGMTATLMVSE